MLKQHRARIDLCCDTIVPRVNIGRLWPKLFEHKIFNQDDVNIPRWQPNLNDNATIKDILLTIKTRGPNAFSNLLKSLKETDQEELAVILLGHTSEIATNNNANNPQHTSQPISQNLPQSISEQVTQNHSMDTVQNSNNQNNLLDELDELGSGPVKIKVRKATEFLDGGDCHVIPRYPMRSKPRGLVLIITLIEYVNNQKIRHAAELDHKNLQELFEQMGFQVIPHWDLSASAIRREVFDFSQRPELRTVDSCFVIISGHGNRSAAGKTVILGVDDAGHGHPDQEISCLDIIQCFSAESCPSLLLKPKVFIFQTCRGESIQYAVMNRGRNNYAGYNDDIYITNSDAPRNSGSRNYSDILIAHSTLPGYVSFRDKEYGSWFIQVLCQVFMRMACYLPIHDLFNKIDEIIASKRTYRNECQTTTLKNIGFHKHLYINPGLFEES